MSALRGAPRVLPVARAVVALSLGFGLGGCAAGKAESPSRDELAAAGATPALREAAKLAPVAFAAAERARLAAERACGAGHDATCDASVDETLAGYALTEATARGVRARDRAEAARVSLTTQSAAAEEAASGRRNAEKEAAELGAELEIATHVVAPRTSGPAPAAREEARRRAAASLAEDAELLCDAAKLAGASAGAADDPALLKVREELMHKPAAAGPLLDDAARARAACLTQLTATRTHAGASGAGAPDSHRDTEAILAAVSAAGFGDDVGAHRDERGVVVVIGSAFDRDELSAHARETLQALAAIAVAHPRSGVQLVAHDATGAADTAEHAALVQHRLDDAARVLDTAGLSASRRRAIRAYARLPLVDPSDATRRARNERLDVVFVVPGLEP